MKQSFGILPSGQEAFLYTISCGKVSATITDFGATLVSVYAPDRSGKLADVALGYDDAPGYLNGTCFLGAVVGRSANRIAGSSFVLNGKTYTLTPNENGNNLHSGPDCYHTRMWNVVSCDKSSITLSLHSPNGDQGFPGNADITLTYSLDAEGGLHIVYDAVSDQDTVFNLTNHSYFNLAGQENTDKAVHQELMLSGEHFCPDDAESIPTGEMCSVEGTPMDFRSPKPISRDLDADFEPFKLQGGYDHNFEVGTNPCAVLRDPESGRTMSVYTDCPGIQFYCGNFLQGAGKGGVVYGKRSGIALETQFFPDSIHHPEWAQPVTKAGEKYHSETIYRFSC